MIRDVTIETFFTKKWIVKSNVYIESSSKNPFEGTLRFKINGELFYSKKITFVSKSLIHVIKVKFEVIKINGNKVEVWWPNGVGENKRNLYHLEIILIPKFGLQITKHLRIGFRTIELIQNTVKPRGLTFNFRVNGLDFFAKGSNWIPAHALHEQLDKKYIRSLLKSAKDANMNMLRVWGGGIYETDYFYEVADEFGIMIWQDMMFACALYPADDNFIKSVAIEIIQNVRRLQHHSSIAVWAGKVINYRVLYYQRFQLILIRKQ